MEDIPIPKRRLTLLPSTEDLTKTTQSTTSDNISNESTTPRASRIPQNPSSSSSAQPTQSTAHGPPSLSLHNGVAELPSSPRRKTSFYSCRDTVSPVHFDADREEIYVHETLHPDLDDAITPAPLQPWRPRRLSYDAQEDGLFKPLNFSKGRDESDDGSGVDGVGGHRRVSFEGKRRKTAIAEAYESLVVNENTTSTSASTGEVDEKDGEKAMREAQQKKISDATTATAVSSTADAITNIDTEKKVGEPVALERTVTVLEDHTSSSEEIKYKTFRTYFMGIIVSMGGLIFGYGGIGQIGGFLLMPDYSNRFGNTLEIDSTKGFSNARAGTIVGLLMIGALIGALVAAPITDRFGRKQCISLWALVFLVGQVIEISTMRTWWQLVIGRVVEGLGIGGLSILTPLYMGEIAPKEIRGVMISCYQLFITLGILLASLVNYGTHKIDNSSSWRITMGIGLAWPAIMAFGVQFLDESPRWDYRKGNIEQAAQTIAKTYSVTPSHLTVTEELQEIQTALSAESAAEDVRWYDVFKAPTMLRRIFVGMVLQMMQQMTGVNYFFYYGTALFAAAGVGDSYLTAVILGAVNFVATFAGLWIAGNVGHRKALIFGGLWISLCLFVYAAMGTTYIGKGMMNIDSSVKTAGAVMVAFSCLAIVGFATTWGPLPWAVCAEIYPAQYRATCMAIATAANWTFNFLIGFFTPFITAAIGYSYGFVFAGVILTGTSFVYLCVHETKDRSLEAIDQMILDGVKPWRSAGPVVDGEGHADD